MHQMDTKDRPDMWRVNEPPSHIRAAYDMLIQAQSQRREEEELQARLNNLAINMPATNYITIPQLLDDGFTFAHTTYSRNENGRWVVIASV